LGAATAERVLVVAADLPVAPPELVLALTAWPERDAVVPRRLAEIQPLCAIYRRQTVLEVARSRLEAGELALLGLLEAVDTCYLEDPDLAAVDPFGAAFLDANVAVDRQRAREILSSLK
jgi:molybdopterin-guanine dinucleotide biosynthesis protein A